ncbi:hypothetical protein M0R45_006217 [Rubus argutus]|uniref:Uncharacterized protein n=1 Tax=Rubus argutus TaxID=59490 RepID=A0AAW1YPQ5_RUBAR
MRHDAAKKYGKNCSSSSSKGQRHGLEAVIRWAQEEQIRLDRAQELVALGFAGDVEAVKRKAVVKKRITAGNCNELPCLPWNCELEIADGLEVTSSCHGGTCDFGGDVCHDCPRVKRSHKAGDRRCLIEA